MYVTDGIDGFFGVFTQKKPTVKTVGYSCRLVPKAGLEPARVAPLPPQDIFIVKSSKYSEQK